MTSSESDGEVCGGAARGRGAARGTATASASGTGPVAHTDAAGDGGGGGYKDSEESHLSDDDDSSCGSLFGSDSGSDSDSDDGGAGGSSGGNRGVDHDDGGAGGNDGGVDGAHDGQPDADAGYFSDSGSDSNSSSSNADVVFDPETNREAGRAPITDDDFSVADDLNDQAAAVFDSWFGRKRSTEAMQKGSKNEASITRALKAQTWCKTLYEVGLVCMAEFPWIGVSADGIAEVNVPGDPKRVVLCATEVKTKVSPALIALADGIARKHGTYFGCTAGTDDWFDVIPRLYRGQLIHQALVFDLEYVLFAVGTVVSLKYSVLVQVQEAARMKYLHSLQRYRPLVEWAHQLKVRAAAAWCAWHARVRACVRACPSFQRAVCYRTLL